MRAFDVSRIGGTSQTRFDATLNSTLLSNQTRSCNRNINVLDSSLASAKQRVKASAAYFEAEVAPRQPALPESWDARSLDDDSISEELKKLKLRKGPLTTRNLSTRHIRSIRNSRLRFRAKSSAAGAQPGYRKETLGVQPGKFLSAEQEAHLVSRWQEWHRIQGLMPSLSGPGYRRAWAKAANMSLEELEECESQGPLAAHLLLASVERLLYNMALKYGQAGTDIEDSLAEARALWLDAASECDPSRARLTSFGTLILKQRLPRVLDRQRSLFSQPPSALYDELRVNRVRQELEDSLARTPSVAEIAKKAGMARATVQNVLDRLKAVVSLEAPAQTSDKDETQTVGDNLASNMSDESEGLTDYLRPEMEETLEYLMDKNLKNAAEKQVCKEYYGFNGKPKRLRELSKLYDCSVETVRKRLIKARAHLNKNGDLQKHMKPYIEEGVFQAQVSDSPSEISNVSQSSNLE